MVRLLISLVFAILYGFMEWRYINNEERDPEGTNALNERSIFNHLRPYHLLMACLFALVSYSPDWYEWGAGFLLMILVEDIAYFIARGWWVREGEWTTRLMGRIRIGGLIIPNWYFFIAFLLIMLRLAYSVLG